MQQNRGTRFFRRKINIAEERKNDMKYETFVNELREAVQNCMGEEMVVEKKEVIKNNGVSVTGLTIADKKDSYSSFLDLQFQYLLYLQDGDMNACVQRIIAEYEKKEERGKLQEVMARVREWDNVREQVYPILISYDDNKEWLAEAVYQRFLDLAICFAVRVPEVHGNIKVKRNLFNLWGITETVLETQAMENLVQDGYTISSVLDILDEMGDAPCKEKAEEEELSNEIPLRILSNANCCLGAAGILYRELLAEYAAKIDKNLFLLPSSLHEIMILPADKGTGGNELKAMVQEINQDYVNPEERLSDHVYYFDREDNSIRIAA